jgi:hypothetical protein
MEIWETKPPGTLWATPGLLRDPFSFMCVCVCVYIYVEVQYCKVTGHTSEIAVSYNVTHKVAVPILHGIVFCNPIFREPLPMKRKRK